MFLPPPHKLPYDSHLSFPVIFVCLPRAAMTPILHNAKRKSEYSFSPLCVFFVPLLQKYGISMIDCCSIDTEGGEYEIVTSMDFEKYRITSFSIEGDNEDISQHLHARGYILHAVWFCALQVPAGNNPVRDYSSVETFDHTAPRMTSVMRTNVASLRDAGSPQIINF